MNLQEFISESLSQIIQAVADAQKRIRTQEINAEISPPSNKSWNDEKRPVIAQLSQRGLPIQTVEFDIAVTATEGTTTKGGVGVVAGLFTLGGSGQSQSTGSNVSRIRFSIPITFPVQN